MGREAVITNNIIDTVKNSHDDADAEGIYTKCRFSTIANNVLIDAGTGDGSIAVKGNTRGATAAPQGFGTRAMNNVLYSTTGAYVGIYIAQDDVQIEGNYFEGFGKYAIFSDALTLDNVHVVNNVVKKHRGSTGIYIAHIGYGCKVIGNVVDEILANQGTITDPKGIYIRASGALTDYDISDNFVYDNDACQASTSVTGIYIYAVSGTIDRLKVNNNKVYIVHSSITEYGISIDATNNITDLIVTGNITKGTANNEFKIGAPQNVTNFQNIRENLFWTDPGTTAILSAHHTGLTLINTLSGTVTKYLPAGYVGLNFKFIVAGTGKIRIDPSGTDTIRGGGAGKYLELDAGETVALVCVEANKWEIIGGYGTYAYEP